MADPANPVPYRHRPIQSTYGEGSLWRTWLVEDQSFVSGRKDVANFRTPVLASDVTVTGDVVADLFAATTGTDADWVVKLIDVYPDSSGDGQADARQTGGYELMVAEEILRGRYRHSFTTPEPVKPGEVNEYKWSLHGVDHTFLKGHRMMVEVQSSWFPLYDRNPQTFVPNIMTAPAVGVQSGDDHRFTARPITLRTWNYLWLMGLPRSTAPLSGERFRKELVRQKIGRLQTALATRPASRSSDRTEESPIIFQRLYPGRLSVVIVAVFILFWGWLSAAGEPVAAKHKQGPMHGFLLLKTQDGKVIGVGDQVSTWRGDVVRSRLTIRFRDGSLDDETTVFRQGSVFQLLSDRHVQKGPSYPTPMDMTIHGETGEVKWLETKDGKSQMQTEHMDLPPDLANGLVSVLIENFAANQGEMKVSYVAGDPKPRLVQLSIKPDGEDSFEVGGRRHRASRFNIHVELGGMAGVVAPVLGKQPSDIKLWIMGGETPAFLKMVGALYNKGPIWTLVLTSPVWR